MGEGDHPGAILGGIALIVLAIVLNLYWGQEPVNGRAMVVVEVVGPFENLLVNQSVMVEPATAYEALRQAAHLHNFTIEAEPTGLGIFVKAVAGHPNDGACGWNFWVDGVFAGVAADRQPVHDGQTVSWRWSCGLA